MPRRNQQNLKGQNEYSKHLESRKVEPMNYSRIERHKEKRKSDMRFIVMVILLAVVWFVAGFVSGVYLKSKSEPVKVPIDYRAVKLIKPSVECTTTDSPTIAGAEFVEPSVQVNPKPKVEVEPKVEPKPKPKVEVESSSAETYKITFYCPCEKCCGKTDGITASGTKATAKRTVAAPKTFAFGTQLYIEGLGHYVVEDRGGSIKGKRLDVFVNSHSEALQLGVKYATVQVVKD